MTRYLDTDRWARRAAFEYFRDFDLPYFEVTAPVDVTALRRHARALGAPFSLAMIHAVLDVVNAYEPFRYRLVGGRVLVHDRVHGTTTTLLEDERLAFAYFDYDPDFGAFLANAEAGRRALADPPDVLEARPEQTDLIHFSSLPWIAFTSMSHARKSGSGDSVPKVVFGKYTEAEGRVSLPVSVAVHHALMDGLHVGRFYERLQERVATP